MHTYENGTVEMAMFFAKKKKKKRGKFLISHNLEMNLEYVKGAIERAFNPYIQCRRLEIRHRGIIQRRFLFLRFFFFF